MHRETTYHDIPPWEWNQIKSQPESAQPHLFSLLLHTHISPSVSTSLDSATLFLFDVMTQFPLKQLHTQHLPNRGNSDSSVSRGTTLNLYFDLIWICSEESELLDLVDFGCVSFSVEPVKQIISHTYVVRNSSDNTLHTLTHRIFHQNFAAIKNTMVKEKKVCRKKIHK